MLCSSRMTISTTLAMGTARQLAKLPNLANARWITTLGVGSILASFGIAPGQVDRAQLDGLCRSRGHCREGQLYCLAVKTLLWTQSF